MPHGGDGAGGARERSAEGVDRGARRERRLEALEVRRASLEDVYLDLVDEEPT